MSPAERQKRYRERRAAKHELLPKILCGCGCGELIAPLDSHGRSRQRVQGHQAGNPSTLVKDGSFWLGRTHSVEARSKISIRKDQQSTSYSALHKWMARHHTKTGICEICQSPKPRTEWALRDHAQLSRERGAWLELCPSCHAFYDIEHNGKKMGPRRKS